MNNANHSKATMKRAPPSPPTVTNNKQHKLNKLRCVNGLIMTCVLFQNLFEPSHVVQCDTSSNTLPTEVIVVEDLHSLDDTHYEDDILADENKNKGGKKQEPVRRDTCVTNRDRYSWRKWLKCWRELQADNERIREACKISGNKFDPDEMPEWTPTWRKRDGQRWKLDLFSNEEELNCFDEREYAKKEWGGRPPYVDYNDPYDSDQWEDMSEPKQLYSSDESFDSGKDYNSDF